MVTFYTIKEVAEILQMSESTIRRRIDDGAIKVIRLSESGMIRITAAEVERIGEGAGN